jgi:hypothetical protein
VLDFVIGSDGVIWVLLDGQWGWAVGTGNMVRLVSWDSVADEVCVSVYDEGSTENL